MWDKWAELVRKEFPLLQRIIYLDNAATTLVPERSISAMNRFYREYCSNIGRSIHRLAIRATEEYEKCREEIASLLNCRPSEVIFTKNTTEAVNIVARGVDWKKDDVVVTTALEHNSNLIPWLNLAKKGVIKEVRIVDFDRETYLLDLDHMRELMDGDVRLVAVTHVSNSLGTLVPLEKIGRIAREYDALFLVDGAQSVGHFALDLKKIDCDFLACPGHKGLLGPQGTGFLYCREDILHELEPLVLGGGAVRDVSEDGEFFLEKSPARFEAGTPNIPGVIGLRASIELLKEIGLGEIQRYEEQLIEETLKGFEELDNIVLYGPRKASQRGSVFSFNIEGLDHHEVALLLDEIYSIAVRSGFHCAHMTIKRLRLRGTVRASYHFYNSPEDLRVFLTALEELSRRGV